MVVFFEKMKDFKIGNSGVNWFRGQNDLQFVQKLKQMTISTPQSSTYLFIRLVVSGSLKFSHYKFGKKQKKLE
jgi:hypothetical protein